MRSATRPARRNGLFLVVIAALCHSASQAAETPGTRKSPVTDSYHGVTVRDDYRWLENGEDPEVKAWTGAQTSYARGFLDSLPARDAIRARLAAILLAPSTGHTDLEWRPTGLFAIKRQPPKEQPFLVLMKSPQDPQSARVLLDPNTLDERGTTAIDWYVPSRDGKFVAVSLSGRGTENGDVYVYDTATGRQVGDLIPRVTGGTAGGDLAWNAGGTGFFYTRYPRAGERPPEDLYFYVQVYFHKLGTPTTQDRYEIGQEFPRIAEIMLEDNPQTGHVLALVQHGDGGGFSHYLRSPDGHWLRMTRPEDQIVHIAFGCAKDLYLLSRKGAPRGKLLRLPLTRPSLQDATTLLPEGNAVIESDFWGPSSVLCSSARLFVEYQLGGPSEIRVFDHRGNRQPGPNLLPVSAVSGMKLLGDGELIFQNASYLEPGVWKQFDSRTGITRDITLNTSPPLDLSRLEVVREFATSKDGARVPVNIIRRKGLVLDHSHPTLATGYGGYGISTTPGFRQRYLLLLEQGVVFAEANIRGGGEFGVEWHEQGRLTRKQNAFGDFAAVLQHLIDRGYTSPEKLAITGGSNGGLLMGATLTQHPQLFQTVVSFAGFYDSLRVELSPNGAMNIPEFGTVKDREQFAALYAYSPYHRVVDGTRYPSVLFFTGANDPRVDPMNSRKMTARLQAATASGKPVLLRMDPETGHGSGTSLSRRIEESVDMFSFLLHELGLTYVPPDKTAAPPPQ